METGIGRVNGVEVSCHFSRSRATQIFLSMTGKPRVSRILNPQEAREIANLLLKAADEAEEAPSETGISEYEKSQGVYQDGHNHNPPITGVADRTEPKDRR
jgi:hypothetical protein